MESDFTLVEIADLEQRLASIISRPGGLELLVRIVAKVTPHAHFDGERHAFDLPANDLACIA